MYKDVNLELTGGRGLAAEQLSKNNLPQIVPQNIRDIMFRHVFSKAENFADLYKVCIRGESDPKPEQLELFDLNPPMNIVWRSVYNDTSFILETSPSLSFIFHGKDGDAEKHIILVEHQSGDIADDKIADKFRGYYGSLKLQWDRYYESEGHQPIPDMPKPEFYVAFCEDKPITAREPVFVRDDLPKAKIVDIHFDTLVKNSQDSPDNPVAGFAFFNKNYNEALNSEKSSLIKKLAESGVIKGSKEYAQLITLTVNMARGKAYDTAYIECKRSGHLKGEFNGLENADMRTCPILAERVKEAWVFELDKATDRFQENFRDKAEAAKEAAEAKAEGIAKTRNSSNPDRS